MGSLRLFLFLHLTTNFLFVTKVWNHFSYSVPTFYFYSSSPLIFQFPQMSPLPCLPSIVPFFQLLIHSQVWQSKRGTILPSQQKQTQTLLDTLYLDKQWKINQACMCINVCVSVCVCVWHSQSTTKEAALGFFREPETETWYNLVEKGEWDRQSERQTRICNKHGRRLVWDLAINKHKPGKGQKLCWCTEPVLNFLPHLFICQSLRTQVIAKQHERKHTTSSTLLHYIQNAAPDTPVDSSPSTHQNQQYQQPLHWYVKWLSAGLSSISLSCQVSDLSLPRETKQQAADSDPAESRAWADGWSCHSLIVLGGN